MESAVDIMRSGNCNSIRRFLDLPHINLPCGLHFAVKSGYIPSIEYVMNQWKPHYTRSLVLYVCAQAVDHSHAHVVKWCFEYHNLNLNIDEFCHIVSLALAQDQPTILEVIEGCTRYKLDVQVVQQNAMRCGSVKVMRWLCERGDVPTTGFIENRFRNTSQSMIELFHEYNIPGSYQEVCQTGTCGACKRALLTDMWKMDTSEFTNTFQWLPREIVEDVLELVV